MRRKDLIPISAKHQLFIHLAKSAQSSARDCAEEQYFQTYFEKIASILSITRSKSGSRFSPGNLPNPPPLIESQVLALNLDPNSLSNNNLFLSSAEAILSGLLPKKRPKLLLTILKENINKNISTKFFK